MFLAGLGLARLHLSVTGSTVLLAGLLLLLFHRRSARLVLLLVMALGLAGGLWRGTVVMRALQPYLAVYKHKVVLEAVATEDAVYAQNSQIGFEADHIRIIKPLATAVPGRIKVAGFGEAMVYRGDVVTVEGSLWPTRGGRQGQISFATITVVAHDKSLANSLRQKFATGMQNALPEPLASFGLGLLIGQRSTLPADVSQQLSVVGLTHLVAVSGYNLTIIVDAVRRLMGKRSKYQSTVTALVLIGCFILITGFSASIVRAALVSVLSIWAWYYGRNIRPVLLITFTAALTAGFNPLYLWGDIGWYLSFLAFFGVIVIAPLVTRRLYDDRSPKLVQAVLIETASAQLMTLPLILYIFQQISPIAIISNVIVVPLVPLAMCLSAMAATAGTLVPMLAGWLAWPARIILTYMLDLVSIFSRLPHALMKYSLSLAGLIMSYVCVIAVTFVLWRKVGRKHGIITETEAV